MKALSFTLILSVNFIAASQAQSKISNIVDGGRALAELISVLRKKPAAMEIRNGKPLRDSCAVKLTADVCIQNLSRKDVLVNLHKRIESGYESLPFSLKLLPARQECWFELRAGIYRCRIETDSAGIKQLVSEGEIKLQACDNLQKEIVL